MAERVLLFEMGPRDGLQNEPRMVPTSAKIELIDRLTDCGLAKIECASFVSPKWVPQMADGAEVMAGVRRGTCRYTALTPNLRGYERARAAGVDEVAVFASASEGFARANLNCSIAESLERFEPVMATAAADGMPVRGYVSCVASCPFDGPTPPAAVADLAARLLAMGCYEISLGDTTGHADPPAIAAMLDAVTAVVPPARLAGHFHDTGGRALENIALSLERGLRTFDAAVGGLGGCPFAPGAAGNVASEAVVAMLHDAGFETGIDLARLREVAYFAASLRSSP